MAKKKDASVSYKIWFFFIGWFCKILFNVHVIGKEPEDCGCLIVSNHTSATDPFTVCVAMKHHQVRYMAKKELYYTPVLHLILKQMGVFPVDRGGNDVGAVRKAITMLKEKKTVGMFPQGHRYPEVDPRTTPAKNGVSLVAHRAKCDVVPVYIHRKENFSHLFKRTYVIFGEKIPYEQLPNPERDGVTYKECTDFIFDRILAVGENCTEIPEKYAKRQVADRKDWLVDPDAPKPQKEENAEADGTV